MRNVGKRASDRIGFRSGVEFDQADVVLGKRCVYRSGCFSVELLERGHC